MSVTRAWLKEKNTIYFYSVCTATSALSLIGKQSWWSSYSMSHCEWKRLAMIWWFHIQQQQWQQGRNSVFTLTG